MYFLEAEGRENDEVVKITVVLYVGRRTPKNWFKRQMSRAAGLISFQENMFQMLKQAFSLAKRKCNQSGKGEWIQTKEIESEDLHYNIEWIKILIRGTEEFEKEEYEEAQRLYEPFNKHFKKDFKVDDSMKKHFKSKVLNAVKVEDAYKKGYGCLGDNNLANKLLEMGILTYIEFVRDYDLRKDDIKPDF